MVLKSFRMRLHLLQITIPQNINGYTNNSFPYFAFPKYTHQFIRNIKQIPLAFAQLTGSGHRAHQRYVIYFSKKLQNLV